MRGPRHEGHRIRPGQHRGAGALWGRPGSAEAGSNQRGRPRRGWTLVDIVSEALSGKSLRRPGLQSALQRVEAGEAECLMVTKLDRLSRSVPDFGRLLERAAKKHWTLLMLDPDVDTSTPFGEAVANVIVTFAQLERRLIGQRTREALAIKKSQGVKLGRARVVPEDVRERIRFFRAQGLSFARIADMLNEEGVPTGRGGRQWYSSTVYQVFRSGPDQAHLLLCHTLFDVAKVRDRPALYKGRAH